MFGWDSLSTIGGVVIWISDLARLSYFQAFFSRKMTRAAYATQCSYLAARDGAFLGWIEATIEAKKIKAWWVSCNRRSINHLFTIVLLDCNEEIKTKCIKFFIINKNYVQHSWLKPSHILNQGQVHSGLKLKLIRI